MALIDLALLADNITYIDASTNPTGTDLINAGVLSADTTVYYGDGSVDLTDVLGVNALSSGYTVASGGADLTLDAGLLDVRLLTDRTLIIDGESSVTIDAGTLGVASVLTDLLNNTTIAFSGSDPGTFTYIRPTVGVLASASLTVEEIGAGDRVVIPISGDGVLGLNILREGSAGYRDGYLNLVNGSGLNTVNIRIKMTQDQYDLYRENPSAFLNADGEDTFTFPGVADPDEPGNQVPCFMRGTLIETKRGPVRIEELEVGDKVVTRDHGLQEIRWIGSRMLSVAELARNPKLRPIRISAGVLGNNKPTTELIVSPQHRILVRSKIAQKMFGATEILVAAKQLLQVEGIDIDNRVQDVEYFHIMFDQHEVVISNGAETESLYAGSEALRVIGAAAREEIFALFPELRKEGIVVEGARLLVSGRMGRKLAVRHSQNDKPLVQ